MEERAAAISREPVSPRAVSMGAYAHGEATGAIPSPALRAWLYAAASWLLLLGAVIPGVIRRQTDGGWLGLAVATGCAFVALYLWLILRCEYRGDPIAPGQVRLRLLLLAILAALTLLLYGLSRHGEMPPWIIVFVAIAAGVTLPTRPAIWAIACTAVVGSVIGGALSHWSTNLPPVMAGVVAVGASMIAVGRLIVALDELRAAREDLARLAVAEERLRFARDLHDLLGHRLVTITIKSELARRLLPADGASAAAGQLEDVEAMTRAALPEIREAVAGYRQTTLDAEYAVHGRFLRQPGSRSNRRTTSGCCPRRWRPRSPGPCARCDQHRPPQPCPALRDHDCA